MFHSGYSDHYAVWDGDPFAIESKFVVKMPVRETSNILTRHDVTDKQREFLEDTELAGGYSVVLVGFNLEMLGKKHQSAIAIPWKDFKKWEVLTKQNLQTLPREWWIPKTGGSWRVAGFFDTIRFYDRR
jgi:hypothetical protein